MALFSKTGRQNESVTRDQAVPQPRTSVLDSFIESYRSQFDVSSKPVTITDPNGVINYVNSAFTQLTGYTREEALGNTPRILKSGKHNALFFQNFWNTLRSGQVWQGEMMNRKKDGSIYIDRKTITPILGSNRIEGFVAVRSDVTTEHATRTQSVRRAEEQSLPQQIDQLIQHATTPRDLLSGAVSLLMTLSDFQSHSKGLAFEVDAGRGVLRLVAHSGQFSDEFLRDEAQVSMGACLCGKAAVSGCVLVCQNCHTDNRHEHKWLGMNAHGHITIPLRTNDRVYAVINLYTDSDICDTDERIAFLANIGFRFGAALERLILAAP